MAKKREQRPGFGRLLEEWTPPQNAGAPIGCLSSTFTLETAFFEEDCLGRFLQMETNAEDHGVAYLIEREEKLATVKCALIVDARNGQGRRSPRWDLLLARVPGACQHAKVTILQWEHHVRLIVASANATEAGCCENLEVYGVLNFHEESVYPRAIGNEIIEFMRDLLKFVAASPQAINRVREFLAGVEKAISTWKLPDAFVGRDVVQIRFIGLRPGDSSILNRLKTLWPSGTLPHTAIVTSPYFDDASSTNRPAEELWNEVMRSRGDTHVGYQVPSEHQGENRHVVNAPDTLIREKPTRHSATVSIAGVPHLSTDEKNNAVLRNLHAKVIHLFDDRWSLALLGSSNFTSKGLGLARNCNIEANLVYQIDESNNKALAKAFEQSLPKAVDFDDSVDIIWTPVRDECEDDSESIPTLPSGFDSATLLMTDDHRRIVRLSFKKPLPENWRICPDGIPDHILDSKEWQENGSPNVIEIPWAKLAAPSGLEVYLPGERVAAWWPVNIADSSALPPPEELRNLPLELLLEILTSSAPLHRVVMRWRERQEEIQKNKFESTHDLDALSRINVSSFLLQRTRRVSAALMALRRSLERPIASKESLIWRIAGPVGVDAVTKAIELEARSPEEMAFLLTELVLELERVRPCASPFGPTVEEIRKDITLACNRIGTRIESINLAENSRILAYSRSVLRRSS